MRTASPLFGSGFPHLGRVTKGLIGLLSVLTIASWIDERIAAYGMFSAPAVLSGEAWRLVTYPWIDLREPLNFVFDLLVLVLFGAQLEMSWGSRLYMKRVALMVLVPPVLVTALAIPLPFLRIAVFQGFLGLSVALVAAWASQLRHQKVMLFPIPFEVSGDGLIYFDAGMLVLSLLASRAYPFFIIPFVSLGFAVAWFRLGWFRGVRRSWLKLRRRQVESRMAKLRSERNLRVISSDDDDEEPRRFLH